MKSDQSDQITVTGSIRRYPLFFAANIILCVAIAFAFSKSAATKFEATSVLVIQDPQTQRVFTTAGYSDPKRYVADQAAIIGSTNVYAATAKRLEAAGFADISASDVGGSATVLTSTESSRIEITYSAATPELATAGAGAMLEAYKEVKRTESAKNLESTASGIDKSVADVDKQITTASGSQASIKKVLTEQQIVGLTTTLQELNDRIATPTGNLTVSESNQLGAIASKLQSLVSAVQIQQLDPALVQATNELNQLVARKTDLLKRKDQLAIDSELGASGVVLASAPSSAVPAAKTGTIKTVGVAGVLGAAMGAGLCYALSVRRKQFAGRLEPEAVLQAPLLSDVPNFKDEKINSGLPVITHPTSASAEALRFVASTLGIRMEASGSRVIAMTSAAHGDGKTSILANTAFALAQTGLRVLTIDADQEHGSLTKLLGGETYAEAGLAEVVAGEDMNDLVREIQANDNVTSIGLLSRGLAPPKGFDALVGQNLKRALAEANDVDLILIDCPPLLQIAQAASLINVADAVVVVVNHGGSIVLHEEIRERLNFIGRPPLGYVYNRAPLRKELASYYVSERFVRSGSPENDGPAEPNSAVTAPLPNAKKVIATKARRTDVKRNSPLK